MRATTTCLIAHDRVKYSVDARAAGRAVLVRVYADRIVALFGEEVVADHPRSFRRDPGRLRSPALSAGADAQAGRA